MDSKSQRGRALKEAAELAVHKTIMSEMMYYGFYSGNNINDLLKAFRLILSNAEPDTKLLFGGNVLKRIYNCEKWFEKDLKEGYQYNLEHFMPDPIYRHNCNNPLWQYDKTRVMIPLELANDIENYCYDYVVNYFDVDDFITEKRITVKNVPDTEYNDKTLFDYTECIMDTIRKWCNKLAALNKYIDLINIPEEEYISMGFPEYKKHCEDKIMLHQNRLQDIADTYGSHSN